MDFSTLESMKQITADKEKSQILIDDIACIGGLVMVLSNPNEALVALALESLINLASHAEFKPKLRDFIGLREQVENVIDKDNGKLNEIANKLFNLLFRFPLKETSNINCSMKRGSCGNYKAILTNSKSKIIVLSLQGLKDKMDIENTRTSLVRVRGLISITFNLQKKRAIIRCKSEVTPFQLASAITRESSHIKVTQVLKTAQGEEILVTLSVQEDISPLPGTLKTSGIPSSSGPTYLPEDADLFTVPEDKAFPQLPNSERSAGSWWNKATSFIENSFFW